MPADYADTSRNTRTAKTSPKLRFEGDRMILRLADGRETSIPLDRYPTLRKAQPAQRESWELIGPARGFHWPELDLDLSVEGLVNGIPEGIPRPPPLEAIRRR